VPASGAEAGRPDAASPARGEASGAPLGWRSVAGLAASCLVAALLAINLGFAGEGTGEPLVRQRLVSERFTSLAATPLGQLPLPVPWPYVQGLDMLSRNVERERWTYCLGRYSVDGFPEYFAVALGLKATLGSLLLMVLAALAVGRRWLAVPRGTWPYLLVAPGFLFVYLSLFFHYQIGLRYLLPALPFLYVVAAGVVASAAGAVRRLAWVLVVAHAASGAAAYPWFLSHFNQLAGDQRQAWRFLVDSNLDWGQADREVKQVFLPAHPEVVVAPAAPMAGRILVRANDLAGLGPRQRARYAWLRDCFRPVDDVGGAWLLYEVTAEELARCAPARESPAPPGRPSAAAGTEAP
jgi:hypothetical protein